MGMIPMTKLLERAFEEASKLSQQKRDALATLIIEELISERMWDESFAKSGDELARLAEEALEEYRAGKTETLDPEKL